MRYVIAENVGVRAVAVAVVHNHVPAILGQQLQTDATLNGVDGLTDMWMGCPTP